jgi:hypothetical protein
MNFAGLLQMENQNQFAFSSWKKERRCLLKIKMEKEKFVQLISCNTSSGRRGQQRVGQKRN